MTVKSLLSDSDRSVLDVIAESAVALARVAVTSNGTRLPEELTSTIVAKIGSTKGSVKITISADPSVKYARAYEWGSGLYRLPGRRISKHQQSDGRIRIKPKDRKILAFHWDKLDRRGRLSSLKVGQSGIKYVGDVSDGRAGFNYVDHPGVQPAKIKTSHDVGPGYLKASLLAAFLDEKFRLSKSVSENVVKNLKVSFRKRKSA